MREKLFVYQEDEQGYWRNHVLMVQEGDQPIDTKELERLSWKVPGAGRISTSAGALIEVSKKYGRNIAIRERREQSKEVPTEWAHLPVVRGATGNY